MRREIWIWVCFGVNWKERQKLVGIAINIADTLKTFPGEMAE